MNQKEIIIIKCDCGCGVLVQPGKSATCPLCSRKCLADAENAESGTKTKPPAGHRKGGPNA